MKKKRKIDRKLLKILLLGVDCKEIWKTEERRKIKRGGGVCLFERERGNGEWE